MRITEYLKLPELKDKSKAQQAFIAKRINAGQILEIDVRSRWGGQQLKQRWFIEVRDNVMQWKMYNAKTGNSSTRVALLEGDNRWDKQYISKASLKEISAYFGRDCSLEDIHLEMYNKINRKRFDNEAYIAGINQMIDKLPFPVNFDRWIHEQVLTKDRFLFYTRVKDYIIDPLSGERINNTHYQGYCTRCNQRFEFWEQPHHYEDTYCPQCGEFVQYRAQGYSRKKLSFVANTAFSQHTNDGNFVIRCFHIKRDYSGKYVNVTTEIDEFARYYFTPERVWFSKNECKEGMGGYIYKLIGGFRLEKSFGIFDGPYHFYCDELADVLNSTFLKHQSSTLADMVSDNKGLAIEGMNTFVKYPVIEYLYKMGFKYLVKDILRWGIRQSNVINFKGRNATEVLGLTKNQLKLFDNYKSFNLDALKWAQYAVKNDCVQDFAYIKGLPSYTRDRLETAAETMNFNHHKMFRYLAKQYNNLSNGYYVTDYLDYLRDCEKLKWNLNDLQIRYPKNLTEAHHRSIEAVRYNQDKIQYEEFCKQVQKWLQKGFSDGVYSIEVIKTPADLIMEAQRMHNCSAGYCRRIADGKCSIWTIRQCENPDDAFYMLELAADGSVVQCRGVANGGGYSGQPPATPEVKAFVDKWLKKKIGRKAQDAKIA